MTNCWDVHCQQTAAEKKHVTVESEIECLRRVAAIDASILPKYLAFGRINRSWVLISEQCANCDHISFRECLQQRFTPQSFVNRLLYILSVLDRAGVVHGDLKLSNLLVTASGEIVVTDFSGSAIGNRVASTNDEFKGVQVLAKDITSFTEDLYAPELKTEHDGFVANVDMYSAGKILEKAYDEKYWSTGTECMGDCVSAVD